MAAGNSNEWSRAIAWSNSGRDRRRARRLEVHLAQLLVNGRGLSAGAIRPATGTHDDGCDSDGHSGVERAACMGTSARNPTPARDCAAPGRGRRGPADPIAMQTRKRLYRLYLRADRVLTCRYTDPHNANRCATVIDAPPRSDKQGKTAARRRFVR